MSEGWTEIFHLCPTGSPMVTDTTLIENIFLYKPLSKRAEFYVPTKPQFDEVIIPSNMLTGFFWLVVHHRLYSTTLHLTIISWDVPMNLSVEKWISFLGTGFKCSVRSGSADIAAANSVTVIAVLSSPPLTFCISDTRCISNNPIGIYPNVDVDDRGDGLVKFLVRAVMGIVWFKCCI